MTAVLTNANSDTAAATRTTTGELQIIVSGRFRGAELLVSVEADSLNASTIKKFKTDASFIFKNIKTGTTVTYWVEGGDSDTAIDVSEL